MNWGADARDVGMELWHLLYQELDYPTPFEDGTGAWRLRNGWQLRMRVRVRDRGNMLIIPMTTAIKQETA